MMKKLILALIFVCLSLGISAQCDTEFWFVCPNIVSGSGSHSDNHMKLCFISYDVPATITISMPAGNPASYQYFAPQTLTMGASSFTTFDLAKYKTQLKDNNYGLNNFGLLIQSTTPIMAYFINTSDDCEAYTLKGKNALGYNFVIPMQNRFDNAYSGKNFVEIVASEDNTDVTVTLPSKVTIQPLYQGTTAKDRTFTVKLNKGQTYCFHSDSELSSKHLANVMLQATKPIAVNSTDDGVDPGDLMGDQLLPVEMLGMHYISVRNDGEVEQLYIFATEDNTTVKVYTAGNTSGTTVQTKLMNRGDPAFTPKFSAKKIDAKFRGANIESDKPIVVFQMTGEEPAGAILPQLQCTGSNEVAFQSVLDNVWADIVVKTRYTQGFVVNDDDSVIVAADFDTVPGTNQQWSYARKQLTSGAVLRVKNKLGLFHLGMYDMRGNSSSLAYFSDFRGAELSTLPGKNFYLTGDTLIMSVFDVESYENISWILPDGSTYEGDSVVIPHATEAHSGEYTVKADHKEGCLIGGIAKGVVNVFTAHCDTTVACSDKDSMYIVIRQCKGLDDKWYPVPDTVFVQARPVPHTYIQGDSIICDGKALLTAYGDFATCAWHNKAGTKLSSETSFTVTQPGRYYVAGYDAEQICSDTTTIDIANGIYISMAIDSSSLVMCSDVAEVVIPFTVLSGTLGWVSVQFDAQAKQWGWVDIDSVSPTGTSLHIPVPTSIRPNRYAMKVSFHGGSSCGGVVEMNLQMEIRYAAHQVMNQKWDDVIILYNSLYNGGYEFSSYQWYRNGYLMPNVTEPYIYLGEASLDPFDRYSVLLTRADDNVSLMSCEYEPVIRMTQVPARIRCSQHFEAVYPYDGEVDIYTTSGYPIYHGNVQEGTVLLPAPDAQGLYIMIYTHNNQTQTFKQIVY